MPKQNKGKSNGAAPKPEKEEPKLTEVERIGLQRLIADFIVSGNDSLKLPGLPNFHRKYLHRYVARLGLKSKSSGKRKDRVLEVRHRNSILSLGDVNKLQMKPQTRQLLSDLMPTIRQLITKATQHRLPQPKNRRRLRSEALLFKLDERLVPPLPRRIDKALQRDKEELPIYRYQDEVNNMLKQHSIFIVNGDTGSGKTTQVPQYILNAATKESRPCRIMVTQPRRIAAVSVAKRVAKERGESIGATVGYQIRMESRVSKNTNLVYTTSGCLLRSIMADVNDLFRKVSHIIIDEIHERDKNTDFTLITIKEQMKLNKDLKVILMSATMDINLLSRYFDCCPVLNVPGKGYNVKIYHLEDILFHTGYRTALMEKYLRSMEDTLKPQEQRQPLPNSNTAPQRLADEYLQDMLESILDKCSDFHRTDVERCELFDQLLYYIESEGMPVDARHSVSGMTPLMVACKTNCCKYVHFFKRLNANVNLCDMSGYSARDYAGHHPDSYCRYILDSSVQQQQIEISHEEAERQRILKAYQQQFNDDNEVDHYLILSLLEGLYRSTHPGSIMVFLPGYNDILQQKELIASTLPVGRYRICILHGQMDSQDQIEALQPQLVRKIILSTNIGQTSITIPDLAYIIDSGKVKQTMYDSVTESSQLQTVWISKADASQRSGRAGRTQNGICYRLYSKAKFDYMLQFALPEFNRIPLTEICLYAKTLESNVDVFTYLSRALSPPVFACVQNAVRKLQLLQVFNDDESVTELGKHLVEIPLDVHLGKCLLYSIYLKCFEPVLTIVAFHSVKDPFILPTDRSVQGHASFLRKSFAGKSFSDQVGILNLYKGYIAVRSNKKRARDFCNKFFLSHSAMETICATRRQISDTIAYKYNLGQHSFNEDWNMIRFCLVAGLYPNIAVIDREKNSLVSGAEKHLILQRTSSLNPPGMKTLKDFITQLPHDWIVFYEKSRVGSMCSINMNTIVPPLIVALKCGRKFEVEALECLDDSDSGDDIDNLDDVDEYETNGDGADNFENTFDNLATTTAAICSKSKTAQNHLMTSLKSLAISDYGGSGGNHYHGNGKALITLDNWIKFESDAVDAKNLKDFRSSFEKLFWHFLHFGHTVETSAVGYCMQKLLISIENANSSSGINNSL